MDGFASLNLNHYKMSTYTIWATVALTALSINLVDAVPQCDLYMAESTIPNAGLGIYTAIERNPGDRVGEGDVCIPILDAKNYHKDLWNPFHDYVWGGEVMGMKLEIESSDKEAYCPGLDCAINCNLALINVAKSTPIYDDGGLRKSLSPGAGAFSPYHNGTTLVTRKIPPGGELFKFYGDAWFATRPALFETLPLSEDYPLAQDILDSFFENNKDKDDSFKSAAYEELLVSISSIWDTRTLNALPKTFSEALVAFEHDIGMVHQPNATRSIEWLQENGRCVDHITPGNSTIEGAGHGGFAKRDLPEGTIITGSPLHHIPMQDGFIPMYKAFYSDPESDKKSKSEITGYQLLMNYCFGHADSTLLLCPYGAGVGYINHNKTRANVKVVWSEDGRTAHNASWLKKEPREMLDTLSARLALDYVATRDIAAGEELFLDYGDAWEEAWNEHMSTWKLESSAKNYIGAREWNKIMETAPIRTNKEVMQDPYPSHLHTRCHEVVEAIWEKDDSEDESEDESDHESDDGSSDDSEDDSEDDWNSIKFKWGPADYGFKCEITERKIVNNKDRYSVKVTTEPVDRWDDEFTGSEVFELHNVPREAIRFFDMPFSSDLFLKGTFRHFMGLPDELMPNQWKNLNQNTAADDNTSEPAS